MARDPLRPNPNDTLKAYVRVQEDFDREMYKTLRRTASSIDEDIKRIVGKGIGDTIRREQLLLVKKSIHEELAKLLRDVGLTVQAGREEAAASAIKTMGAYDRLLFNAAHIPADAQAAYMTSAEATARSGITSAVRRMQGDSYVPLSKQVYKTEALARGMVDRYINQALIKGLSAREFAKGVASFIQPNVAGGVSYASMRLARTEINNAFHATQAKKARETPWVSGVEWNLSGSHPTPDECNDYADSVHYAGGEPGIFLPEDVPPKPHPQCLCFITSVTVSEDDFIDNLFGGQYDSHIDDVMRKSGYTEDFISASQF